MATALDFDRCTVGCVFYRICQTFAVKMFAVDWAFIGVAWIGVIPSGPVELEVFIYYKCSVICI